VESSHLVAFGCVAFVAFGLGLAGMESLAQASVTASGAKHLINI
jgi:hypothetical protein